MNGPHPDRRTARNLLEWAHNLNPGPWLGHSETAARAAETIAARAGLNADKAYALGLLHDIGRYKGVGHLRHVYDGYMLMLEKGWLAAARICVTHSFPQQDIRSYIGKRDCSPEEIAELNDALMSVEYDDYDRLIQLCDALAMPGGVCPMEVRMLDAARRNGINELTPAKWDAYFAIKRRFDSLCGANIFTFFADDMRAWFEEYIG